MGNEILAINIFGHLIIFNQVEQMKCLTIIAHAM